MMLLFLLLMLAPLAWADEDCDKANPSVDLPECTDNCLLSQKWIGLCATNLQGFCRFSETWFARFSDCLLDSCSEESDRQRFVDTFKEQCEQTEWALTSIPGDFGRYLSSSSTSQPTIISISASSESGDMESQTSPAVSTSQPPVLTSTVAVSTFGPPVFTSFLTTSNPGSLVSTAFPSAAALTPSSSPQDTTAITTVIVATPTSNPPTAPPHSSAHSEPFMTTAKIAWTVAGGTVLIIACIGGVLFLLHRRRRRQRGVVDAIPASNVAEQQTDEKHELHGQSAPSYGAPIPAGVVEMDAGSPVYSAHAC